MFGVLGLALFALGAEVSPEFKAKLIVIPTLLSIVLWIGYNLYRYYFARKNGDLNA